MEVHNSSTVGIDWNDMYDVFVDYEKQHPTVEAEQRPLPSPPLEGDQAQLSFYEPEYDAGIVSQTNTFVGADLSIYSTKETDLSVYSTLEKLKEISSLDQYFHSGSVNDSQQPLDYPTGHAEPASNDAFYSAQNFPSELYNMGFYPMGNHNAENFHGENYSDVSYPVEYYHMNYLAEQQPVENFPDKDFDKGHHAGQIYSEVHYFVDSGAENHTVDNNSEENCPEDPLSLKQIVERAVEDENPHTIENDQIQKSPVNNYPSEYYPLRREPGPSIAAQPQQQIVPQEPVPDNTLFGLPIQLNIVGYLNPDGTLTSMMPSPKKSRNRRPKPRKTGKLHKIIGDYPCKQCERTFKSKSGLSQHNNSNHSGPMPHQCSICGKRFRDIDIMILHHQRHSQRDKPYKCTDCSKQFMFSTDLHRHVNLHHGVCRFVCSICGKAFDRRDHLRDHEMSHLNGTAKKSKASKLRTTVAPSV